MTPPTPNLPRSRSRRLPYSRSRSRFRKPSPFEFFRIAVYALAFIWSLVALAIAAHFQSLLQSSDLTRFIPFALFVSLASVLSTLGLISLVVIFNSSPFSIKAEILASGLIGILWLILATLTSLSPAEDAEVECFSVQDESELVESSFTTDTFHAQYRVLVAASCINVLCLLGTCAFLALLAFRHFKQTSNWVTYTREPLLGKHAENKGREKSRSSSRGTTAPLTALPKKAAVKVTEKTKDKVKGLPLPSVAKGAHRAAQPGTSTKPPSKPSAAEPSKKPTPPPVHRSKTAPVTPVPPKKKPSVNSKPAPVSRSKTTGGAIPTKAPPPRRT